ncbi:HNH endonuclease [Candidatus Bathyarchaeota archaeon]|nr:HNH endonuclease [Candidatus Bathyarchaeota archaeon]
MGRGKDFSEDTRLKCVLWSDRYCCLCGKACGPDIEIVDIDPEGGNDLDNAIPVCYYCHATREDITMSILVETDTELES